MAVSFRKLIPAALFSLLLATMACGGSEEKAEQVAADETAEQMEAANLGRTAAKQIIGKEWSDTLALQNAVLHARSMSSKYDMEKQRKCREAFDTAFFNTIRNVRPDLAKQISGE